LANSSIHYKVIIGIIVVFTTMILSCRSGAEEPNPSYTPLEIEIQELNDKIAQSP